MKIIEKNDFFIVIRSLELNVDNAAERTEALKLSGLMLRYNSEQVTAARDIVASRMAGSGRSDSLFPRNILRTVSAIARTYLPVFPGKSKTGEDELALSCIALIAEQAVLSPDLILDTLGAGN
ncbi:unnamed protein product [Gongylonema pulchrum]|uniref:RICTOR_N domain-containing protein n=1 Tax=Gongylonema pulchrum TaxID=637853 RepID=A0A183E9F1_9BILA|nr:unnamed protein product [Gongylonema pulchrum]